MKLGVRRAARFESGPNMTPLVDIVMCILIFLMLVGTFASGEHYLLQNASVFNTATSANQPPPKDFVPDEPIIVRVSELTDVGDRYLAQADRLATSDKASLVAGLTKMREDLLKIGKKPEKLAVVIQPKPNVKHRHYFEVYEAAVQAGFGKVSFAVSS